MSRVAVRRAAALAVTLAVMAAGLAMAPAATASSPPPWRGSADAKPSQYPWIYQYPPGDTYDLTIIRGLSPHQVLHRLGVVRRDLGRLTPGQAMDYGKLGPGYSIPTVVQVSHLGHAVVVWQPGGARAFFHESRLSRGKVRTADFITDVDDDTFLKIARHGHLVCHFDAYDRPPCRAAVPQVEGLHFGRRHDDPDKTSWALLERVSLIHVTRSWFRGTHPTFVLRGRS
jgi:hypothetical protein